MEPSLCLENLKVNDEIVVIRKTKNKLSYGSIYVVSGWNDELKLWNFYHPNFPEKIAGRFPSNGYGYDFMSKRIHPNLYYSANQKHIKDAKNFHLKSKLERIKIKDEFSRRMKLAITLLGIC